LQRAITAERYEERIGARTTVLIDRAAGDGELAQARAPWQADDVDGVTWVETTAPAGSFVDVAIEEVVDDYDFHAIALEPVIPVVRRRTSRALPLAAVGPAGESAARTTAGATPTTIGSYGR
jgi:ribosomal protein S12 methylthiotransferase